MVPVPALPPYGPIDAVAAQCIVQASSRYEVPELLLHAVIRKEGGRMGRYSKNKNGSFDFGLAQINTVWLKQFATYGITPAHLLNDTCVNVSASAYVLKYNWLRQKDWFKAIVAYNIGNNNGTPNRYAIGYKYAADVLYYWRGFNDYVEKKAAYDGALAQHKGNVLALNK
jgi:soluble lytic murein transglycosylase-like protein